MSELEDIVKNIMVVYKSTGIKTELTTHHHNSHEIIYILEGSASFNINGKKYVCGPNSILFISNLESHELKVTTCPYRRYYILINPKYLHYILNEPVLLSIFKNRPKHFAHVVNINGHLATETNYIFNKLYQEYTNKAQFWEINAGSYLALLLVNIYRSHRDCFPLVSTNQTMNLVLEIQKYIDEHYAEQIKLAEISKKHFTDMCYLSRLFKKTTGYNFKEYLVLQRVSKAKELLFYTSYDITRVGLDAGFNNVNHFIRIFKRIEGITPYQYRKKVKSSSTFQANL